MVRADASTLVPSRQFHDTSKSAVQAEINPQTLKQRFVHSGQTLSLKQVKYDSEEAMTLDSPVR